VKSPDAESNARSLNSSDEARSSDLLIIERVLAGEKDEFRKLVTRHKNLVFGMIMRLVGSRDIADELAQESFVNAFLKLRSFRAEAAFSTWLTRIALNVSKNYLASKRYKENLRNESFDSEIHDREQNEETNHLEELRLARFRQAIHQLRPKLRDVVTLCSLEGKSYEETAQILQIPVGTVRSRLNKARLKLRTILDQELSNA